MLKTFASSWVDLDWALISASLLNFPSACRGLFWQCYFGYNVLKIVWPEFEREISEILWPQFWKPWPSILMGVSKDTTQHWEAGTLPVQTFVTSRHSDSINTTFWSYQQNFLMLSTHTICRNSRLQMRNSQQHIWSLFMLEATVEQKCILHNCRTGLEWKKLKLKIYATATYVAPY